MELILKKVNTCMYHPELGMSYTDAGCTNDVNLNIMHVCFSGKATVLYFIFYIF